MRQSINSPALHVTFSSNDVIHTVTSRSAIVTQWKT